MIVPYKNFTIEVFACIELESKGKFSFCVTDGDNIFGPPEKDFEEEENAIAEARRLIDLFSEIQYKGFTIEIVSTAFWENYERFVWSIKRKEEYLDGSETISFESINEAIDEARAKIDDPNWIKIYS